MEDQEESSTLYQDTRVDLERPAELTEYPSSTSITGDRVVPVSAENELLQGPVSEPCIPSIPVTNSTQNLICIHNDLDHGSIPHIKTKGIKFAHLNIHSLVSKIDELRVLLKHRPFDVICFNETLCDSSISDDEICIDGFSIVRRDRIRHGGGVAI